MSATFYELLKYAKTGIASPEMTHYDKLKALAMCKGGFPVSTLTGIPPISFKSDGTPLTAWSIAGNMVQTGTPTPSAPIMPEEMCDKTANLVPEIRLANGWRKGYRNGTSGAYVENQYYGEWLSPPVSIDNFASFVVSAQSYSSPSMSIYYFNGETYLGTQSAYNYTGSIFNNIPNGSTHFDFAIRTGCTSEAQIEAADFWIMLNSGSAALPYEPGYKIPLTCGGTTSTVYLQEPLREIENYADSVSSDGTVTRWIKKLVLTGGENWSPETTNVFTTSVAMPKEGYKNLICTHYGLAASYSDITSKNNVCAVSKRPALFIKDSRFTISSDFKAYLAEQYAAGTPVCVWYVLATEQSETVTAPTITPAKGTNTLTVDTDLQPSEVSITGHIKSN